MRISLKNIGLISNADIEINSLTVVTGVNDTGKSTIGKMLFSIVKAFGKYEEDLGVGEQERVLSCLKILNSVIYKLRKETSISYSKFLPIYSKDINYSDYKKERDYLIDLNTEIEKSYSLLRILKSQKNVQIEDLEQISHQLSAIGYKLNDKLMSESLENELLKVKKIFQQKEDKEDLVKKALRKALISEFYSDISFYGNSEVTCKEGDVELIHFEIEKNNIKNFRSNNNLFLDESTFIESPTVLHLYDVLKYANTFFELEDKSYSLYRNRGRVPFHIKDLMSKLEKASYFSELDEIQITLDSFLNEDDAFQNNEEENANYLIDEISKVINGSISYSKKSNDFIYYKKINGTNQQIKSVNTATGIKSFGILQLLLKLDFLNERHLLIIDEPESNLHPEWQLKYAETIMKLAKHGTPVLVTTHSPYMVQALSFYSKKENLSESVRFYLVDKENEFSKAIDVSNDLRPIFLKLSKPLEEMVWD